MELLLLNLWQILEISLNYGNVEVCNSLLEISYVQNQINPQEGVNEGRKKSCFIQEKKSDKEQGKILGNKWFLS